MRYRFVFLMLLAPLPAQSQVKIVCLGDSVTAGVREGVTAEQTFCVLLKKNLEKAGYKAEVVNAGIGGQTTANGVARLEKAVIAEKPRFVVIMYGINDSWIEQGNTKSTIALADYSANLKKMIVALRSQQITPILMTANPVAAPKYPPERDALLKKYVEAMRAVAKSETVRLVDVHARYGELAKKGTDPNTLLTDAMHPNPKGHALIADLLTKVFRDLLGK